MRKILIAALALLALLFLGRLLLPLFFVPSSHSARAEAKRPSVRVATVQLAQLRPQLPLVAKLQALQSILVTPEVSGRITALPDAQGGEVAAGARLIQLDDAQQRAALTDRVVLDRQTDVDQFYNTESIDRANILLARYNIRFVVVGDLEAAYYSRAGLEKFERMADLGYLRRAYTNEGTRIYAVVE